MSTPPQGRGGSSGSSAGQGRDGYGDSYDDADAAGSYDDDEPTPAEEYKYRVRRQRRAVVTLVFVLLALAAAIYYASTYYRDTTPKPAACTTVTTRPALKPSQVGINVLNATSTRGLALAASKQFAARGFVIKTVANDPLKKPIAEPAQIRFGPAGEAAARVVATYVPGAVLVSDKRQDTSVDVALGAKWKAVGPAPTTTSATTSALPLCPAVSSTTIPNPAGTD